MQFVLLTLKKQKQRKSPISTQPIYHQPQPVEQTETSGLGILESLLSDVNITDILVNGHKGVWVDRGNGLEKTKLTFLNEDRAIEIAEANDADILTCEINPDNVYIETFSKFNNAQVSLFNQLGINDDGVIGKAKAK